MFARILVPQDGSRLAARILRPLERLLAEDVEVTLLRVVEAPEDQDSYARQPAAELAMRAHLEQLRGSLASRAKAHVVLLHGEPGPEVARHARETGQDLVAMTTHGRTGVQRWVRGSVAEQVLRTCEVPLLLCNPAALEPHEERTFHRIVVPLDGSARAERIVPLVAALARPHASRVTLLRVEPLVVGDLPAAVDDLGVLDPTPLAHSLEAVRARLATAGIEAECKASFGVVAAEILREAQDADLLAVTTHGRNGVSRLVFGSVAEQIVRHAPCPLLVLRTVPTPAPTPALHAP